jgi:AmmeMemoRadiSam system protein B
MRIERCGRPGAAIIVAAMPGPSRSTRRPAVAGRFYPADAAECASTARQFVQANADFAARAGKTWRGAIVPHAGWMFSGAIAGEAIGTLKASRDAAHAPPPLVVVVFGAVHTPMRLDRAAMDAHDRWAVPGGESNVSTELSRRLEADASAMFALDPRFHEREHAVEVELPLIQQAWPDALLMPIEVPLIDEAAAIGRAVARQVAAEKLDAVYLASSDLTHYGPDFSFVPGGAGEQGLQWAKENDRRLLDVVAALRIEAVVPEVRSRANACGGGAIAAMLAACREHDAAGEVRILRHETSDDVMQRVAPTQRPDNAGVVVG